MSIIKRLQEFAYISNESREILRYGLSLQKAVQIMAVDVSSPYDDDGWQDFCEYLENQSGGECSVNKCKQEALETIHWSLCKKHLKEKFNKSFTFRYQVFSKYEEDYGNTSNHRDISTDKFKSFTELEDGGKENLIELLSEKVRGIEQDLFEDSIFVVGYQQRGYALIYYVLFLADTNTIKEKYESQQPINKKPKRN